MLINWDFFCPVTEQNKQININVYNLLSHWIFFYQTLRTYKISGQSSPFGLARAKSKVK